MNFFKPNLKGKLDERQFDKYNSIYDTIVKKDKDIQPYYLDTQFRPTIFSLTDDNNLLYYI